MLSFLNIFRIVAFLEGLSYILLLFVATPIKYIAGNPEYVKLLGMPHGLLFILYLVLAVLIKSDMKWSTKTFSFVLLASIIPFGTFYVERKYLNLVNS
ncbi:DUF3817 domain-containing protein [Flaviramulus aquimarinus]